MANQTPENFGSSITPAGTTTLVGQLTAGGTVGRFLASALPLSSASTTALAAKADTTYVDGIAAGLSAKNAVRAATTANITLSGAQTIDGVSVVATDRVLVKDQSSASANGIYVAAAGAWARAADMDAWAEVPGAFVPVQEGTANADTFWVSTANAGGTLNTTSITWAQFGALAANNSITYAKMQDVSAASKLLGRGSAGGAGDPEEITLGTNLSMSGTTLNATSVGTADDRDIATAANPASPYTASGLVGDAIVSITGLTGNLTINKPTGTWTTAKRYNVDVEVTASGGTRTISFGSGIALALGVAPTLDVASGKTLAVRLYTDDGGTSFKYDGDVDFTGLPTKATPTGADPIIIADSAASNVLKQTTLAGSRNAVNRGTTALTDAATVATDCATGNVFTVTLGGNRTLGLPTNIVAGATYVWVIKQDATGTRTLAFNAAFLFEGGTDPTASTAANAVDMLSGLAISTSQIVCSYMKAFA